MEKEYLRDVLQLIDVAVSRGAVRGEEIYGFAAVRKKTQDMLKEPEPDAKELIAEALKQNANLKENPYKKPVENSSRVTKKNDAS